MAHQELAVQGDDIGKSNFIPLLRLQSKTFPELTDSLSKKTERYTSYGVQKEIINLMFNQIVRNLLKPGSSCVFSVMRNDCTEVYYKEQLTFCMRWVNNDIKVSEKLLGFNEIMDIKSNTIVTVMKDIAKVPAKS